MMRNASNSCSQCNEEHTEACYLLDNVVNNICNQQSVNESNKCVTYANISKTSNGQVTECQPNYFHSDDECKKCPEGCRECLDNVCYSCDSDYQLR